MPSSNNNNKNKKNRGGNFTGLITLIAWALFLTVIINFMANYSLRGNNVQRSTRAEIVYTDFLDMIRRNHALYQHHQQHPAIYAAGRV